MSRPRPSPILPDATGEIRQRFPVWYDFPVVFTWDALAVGNDALVNVLASREPTRRHRVCVVVDAGVLTAFPELPAELGALAERERARVELVAAPFVVPGGEAAKNDPALIGALLAHFQGHRMDRHSFVLVIGGGGVLDAVGYAAATAHRGLRLVRMPTTVLAQDDSGVGVKNGVNAFGAKNFLGTFVPPFAVINDFRFLERLPRREIIAGLAEGVKVSLIRDADFFAWIEVHADRLAGCELGVVATLVRRCAELHMRHIATGGDPFELGSARPLDFGHWSAHKLETLTSHELRHGEAVAIGLRLDARYSHLAGLLPAADLARIDGLLTRLGLPAWHPALDEGRAAGRPAVLGGLADFREHLGGDLTVTMLTAIGRAVDVHEMDEARILAAIDFLRGAQARP